jgi:hypothetical protein
VAASRFDRAAMLAKDQRKAGIGINATPFIEAMSAYHKVGDGRTRHAERHGCPRRHSSRTYPGRALTVVA